MSVAEVRNTFTRPYTQKRQRDYRTYTTSQVAAHLRLVQVADEGEWGGSWDAKPLEVLVGMVGKAATYSKSYTINKRKELIYTTRVKL